METADHMRTGDLLTIVGYFVLTMGIGFWCMRKNRSTDDFFVGGRSVPGWAIGLSLLGTAISSISFLAYPGNAYGKDWSLIVPGFMLPIAALLGAWIFVPFYRASRFTSAYEYLEGRFSSGVRFYGVVMYLIGQIWRLGSVLFLLTLPIQIMTGWDPLTVIWVVGVCTTIYCVVGGLEAVIWTDVMQTLVLIGGGLACVLIVFLQIGPAAVFETAFADNKFNLTADTTFSINKETLWVLILWGLVSNIQEHVSDQIKVQRYCATKDRASARRAVMFNGLMCIPVWCLFMFIGTCLYAFYKVVPDPVVASMEQADKVFPHFILVNLPVGISGLVIAAVLAAAMSTLSGSMNAAATVLTVDIYQRYFVKGREDHHYLTMGKVFSLLGGVLMIATALVITLAGNERFLPLSFFITSVVVGGLGGLFCVGFFSTRASAKGMMVGIVCAVLTTVYLTICALDPAWLPDNLKSPTHKYMIGVFSNVAAFVFGYFGSFLFAPPTPEQLSKATFWTLEDHLTEGHD